MTGDVEAGVDGVVAGAEARRGVDLETWQAFREPLGNLLSSLPEGKAEAHSWTVPQYPPVEGLAIPAQVNFVGKAANLFDLGYRLDGSISVISKYLGTTWLWEKVRVQGGAYGAYFNFDGRSGILTFLSYRDPNLLGTLKTYDQTSEFLRKLNLSQEELAKTIIGVIGDLDSYQLPDAKGYTSMIRYLVGDTDKFRQQYRDQVFTTTVEHFRSFGEMLGKSKDTRVAVMVAAEKLAETNQERNGWMDIKKVL